MYIISLPLMIESHQILNLWLGTPPEGAYLFVVWTILSSFTTLLGNTLVTLQMAHGNIKHYQIWITVTAHKKNPTKGTTLHPLSVRQLLSDVYVWL